MKRDMKMERKSWSRVQVIDYLEGLSTFGWPQQASRFRERPFMEAGESGVQAVGVMHMLGGLDAKSFSRRHVGG